MIKERSEIEAVSKACEISSNCIELISEIIDEDVKESEIKAEVLREMIRMGAEKAAFDIIVASGPRSSFPHGYLGDRVIQRGDVVVVDIGAIYQGYCSNITRAFYIGGKPDEEVSKIYELVLRVKREAEEELKPGVFAFQLYESALKEMSLEGYGEYFLHALGHGIGIEIHEPPRIIRGVSERLENGMIITIEPGIYLPKKFGIRIEDTLLIGDEGIEVLTSAPYDLVLR